MRRWCAFVALALLAACSNGAHSAIPNAPAPNAPMGVLGPRLHLRIAHLGKPHYFFSRPHFASQSAHRAHSGYYYGVGNLQYGGGPVDVTPKAYLIFWGITGPTDTTHDPDGLASYITQFFAALPNSSWLNTVTQYYGTYTGPTQYITNPSVAFTGAYYDPTPPSSATYTDPEAANEALKVANIVGYNADTNYIVVSPHGYTISGFGNNFCAYHSASSTSSSQLLSYTVFPYQPDAPSGKYPAGSNCGLNSVNYPGGTLDGVSIVSGHEEAETITDADASSGWLDSSSPQMEIGDKCAWIKLQNSSFPNGHSYPTQPLWSNASSSCVQSYGGGGPTPSPPPATNVVVNSGFETSRLKPWTSCRSSRKVPLAFTTTQKPHGGNYDAYAGTIANHKEPAGLTAVCQLITIPASGQLTVWTRGISDDKRRGVYQFVRLYAVKGSSLALAKTVFKFNSNDKKWVERTASLASYAGKQFYLALGIQGKANAHGRIIGLFVDDVSLAP